MEKVVNLGEKSVKLKATGALPRVYRIIFTRDIFKDMAPILQRYQNISVNGGTDLKLLEQLGDHDLEILENLTYAMAWAADPDIQQLSPLEWLDQFSYRETAALQQEAVLLWVMDNYTIDKPKKKLDLPNVT